MAGTKINNYSQIDTNIEEVQITLDLTRTGLHKVSLTNWDNTSVPQIAAGSVIEVAGSFYQFESDETITGSPSDGTVYIIIIPGTTSCTAQFTNTVPVWNAAYQGLYGTGSAAGYRYLEFKITKTGTSYSEKKVFLYHDYIDSLTIKNLNTTVSNVSRNPSYYLNATSSGYPGAIVVFVGLGSTNTVRHLVKIKKTCSVYLIIDKSSYSDSTLTIQIRPFWLYSSARYYFDNYIMAPEVVPANAYLKKYFYVLTPGWYDIYHNSGSGTGVTSIVYTFGIFGLEGQNSYNSSEIFEHETVL